jgi:hypothetical protein
MKANLRYTTTITQGIKSKLYSILENGVEIVRSLSKRKAFLLTDKLNGKNSEQEILTEQKLQQNSEKNYYNDENCSTRNSSLPVSQRHEESELCTTESFNWQSKTSGCENSSTSLSKNGSSPQSVRTNQNRRELSNLTEGERCQDKSSRKTLESALFSFIGGIEQDAEDIRKESVNIRKESVNIRKESVNIRKESVNIRKESVNIVNTSKCISKICEIQNSLLRGDHQDAYRQYDSLRRSYSSIDRQNEQLRVIEQVTLSLPET